MGNGRLAPSSQGIDAPSKQCENSDAMTGDEVATGVRTDAVVDELLSGVSDDDASDCDSQRVCITGVRLCYALCA